MSQTIVTNGYDFSEELTMPTSQIEQTIAFTSNNVAFSGMRITTDTMYYVKSDGSEVEVYNTSTKWSTDSTNYQNIAIDTNVVVSDTFGNWFSSNAVKGAYSLTMIYKGATYTIGGGAGGGGGQTTIELLDAFPSI